MIRAGLTLAQMLRATKAVKSLPKAKTQLPQMPKKTGWRKSAFGKTEGTTSKPLLIFSS